MLQVTWQFLTNKSALFQHGVFGNTRAEHSGIVHLLKLGWVLYPLSVLARGEHKILSYLHFCQHVYAAKMLCRQDGHFPLNMSQTMSTHNTFRKITFSIRNIQVGNESIEMSKLHCINNVFWPGPFGYLCFFKFAIPGLFSICFRLFKRTLKFVQQINVKNIHPFSSFRIQCQDSNPQPSENESPHNHQTRAPGPFSSLTFIMLGVAIKQETEELLIVMSKSSR